MSVGLKLKKVVSRGYFEALGDQRVNPLVTCTSEEDQCRQADAAACDINAIVRAQMRQFGTIPEVPGQLYADVSAGWDFREVMEKAAEAKEFFMALPSEAREAYQNDPALLFDALVDPAEVPRLQELGILKKDPVPEVPEVPRLQELGILKKDPVPEVPNEVPANPPA